jgi:hypothetical protein
MAELDWVTCLVALGGDVRSIVYKGPTNPITVPEIDVLIKLHGDASVTDVEFFETTESNAAEEKNRLLSKYPEPLVSELFPGRNPNMGLVFADRRGKEIAVPDKKNPKPTTKHTAAKVFMPPDADAE